MGETPSSKDSMCKCIFLLKVPISDQGTEAPRNNKHSASYTPNKKEKKEHEANIIQTLWKVEAVVAV